jgi:ribosomal protein S18 acetylase RimI-like enzyme
VGQHERLMSQERDGARFHVIYPIPQIGVGAELRRMAQSGRTSLRFFLGDDERRSRAFENAVNDDRVIGLVAGDKLLGMVAFTVKGKGPLSPKVKAFAAEYGWLRGWLNFVIFNLTEPWGRSNSLYIYNFQVASQERGQGAGGALLDALEPLARSMGCQSISVQVATHNTAMIVYLKKGFRITGTLNPGPLRLFFPFKLLVNLARDLSPPKRRRMVLVGPPKSSLPSTAA